MRPENDDRRTAACCAAIVLVPVLLAAAQTAVRLIVERWVVLPLVASALTPLALLNALLAGVAAAWATVLLPGGRITLTIVAAVAGFIVGATVYAVALLVCSIAAELL